MNCTQYLQAKLPAVAERTRDVKVEGHILKDLSIISRSGKSMCNLFDDYERT